ncbi:MAG: hypothetical protein C4K60_11355 [Ideonella sp. MAG2]|nr:MAG: hypothetical protein C4K60_11355 [Ideonella sp. MAG2]
MAYRKVINVFERMYQGDMYDLHIQGRYGHLISIDVTGNHPMWVVGKGWVEARDLIVGDELQSVDGKRSQFLSLTLKTYMDEFVVYNLEVEGFNTYFVSAEFVWVHNCNKQTAKVKVAEFIDKMKPT